MIILLSILIVLLYHVVIASLIMEIYLKLFEKYYQSSLFRFSSPKLQILIVKENRLVNHQDEYGLITNF